MKAIWDFGQREMDQQINCLKKYTSLVTHDTEGRFIGELIIEREYGGSKYSIWLYSPKKPSLRVKFFEMKRWDKAIYPVILNSIMEKISYECQDITHLDKQLVAAISSEKVAQALSNFVNIVK